MTMQRQYVLPNCSLTLEGLSTDPASGVLTILANAECKIVGIDPPLSGGLDFFKALVTAVSQYAQSLLSNLPRLPQAEGLVQLTPDQGQYHRLVVQPDTAGAAPLDLRLSTVQLFDLTEAIDQFLADPQTLPELTVALPPLPRRLVKSSAPMGQRVAPPLIGLGTFAAAAAGLFFLPVPKVPEFDPTSIEPVAQLGSEAEQTDPSGTDPGAAGGSDSQTPDTAPDSPSSRPAIETTTLSAAETAQLQTQLTEQLETEAAAPVEAPLSYEVSVAENGDIVGYRPEDAAALDFAEQTPLPELTYIPVGEETSEPVARFRVSFLPDGSVDVDPWEASSE